MAEAVKSGNHHSWIGEDILKTVHPDLSADELGEKIEDARIIKSTELWKLVDGVASAAE